MHFTRLRLNGFKSFVDPTELVIREGLTGVVGPNGCGKSNLLEALRWVMGENRPTAMRGSGMEDVVFAGTSKRGARAYAEVGLSVDNQDRLAPPGFNDSDVLDVTRRITRDAGSAYKVNGKDVRARDVQMLFADASTGAHSPALVRQGQISELINAKPKARRRILEEAAGISGLYQRRHEAELRLNATEANLSRVADVVEALAQQMAVLARQARQAARYREVAVDLRRFEGMLLYRRWREASQARAEVQSALTEAITQAAAAERGARDARATREQAEDVLPPLREEEAIAGAILQRLQVQRDTLVDQEARAREAVQTLMARIEQLRLDAQREAGLAADANETIERLRWEEEQLVRAGDGHEEKLAEAVEAAREASDVLADAEAHLTEATEDVARLSARHQSLTRQATEARAEGIRAATGAQRASDEALQAVEALEAAEYAQASAAEARDASQDLLEAAEETLIETEAARADAQAAEVEARAARAGAEGEATALSAELGALDRLIARDTDSAGAILDQISVDPGYEHALGAALADDLRAPIAAEGSGWYALPAYDAAAALTAALPAGVLALTDHVRAPAQLSRRLAQVGLVDAAVAASLHASLLPGQRLVTVAGDLWRWDGLMQRAEDAPSAAAIRLTQINRQAALRAELDEAEARQEAAQEVHQSRQSRLSQLTEADRMAREARRSAEMRLTEASRAASRAEADASLLQSKRESSELALERMQAEAEAAEARLVETEEALAELDDLEAGRARLETIRTQVEAARMAMMSRRAAQDEFRRDGAARRTRTQEVAREVQSWVARKETAAERITGLENRAEEAAEDLAEANAAPEEIQARREELGDAITEAETRRTAAIEAMLAGESALRAAQEGERATERGAGEAREARARAEARVDAAGEAVTLAANRIADELDTTPQGLLNQLEVASDDMPDMAHLDTEIARLKRARDALGAVNLRAEEDARVVQEEHTTLVSEQADLEAAIHKLRGGIAALNREGRERLLAAFEEVNASFVTLFTHLFGGGEARLVLVESDDPLEAGLEILCQPPGKKLASLSLLSGGEQTLTALALIFAVFLANPAPICVLDEVDAPLDDANVMRFCDLLDEMTRRTETRFLIITHNALSMARMDRLFGVTMAEQGVSQLVSVDLARAEALVA